MCTTAAAAAAGRGGGDAPVLLRESPDPALLVLVAAVGAEQEREKTKAPSDLVFKPYKDRHATRGPHIRPRRSRTPLPAPAGAMLSPAALPRRSPAPHPGTCRRCAARPRSGAAGLRGPVRSAWRCAPHRSRRRRWDAPAPPKPPSPSLHRPSGRRAPPAQGCVPRTTAATRRFPDLSGFLKINK